MSTLGIGVCVGTVVFVVAFVAALGWCDRRDEQDAKRRARRDFDASVHQLNRAVLEQGAQFGERIAPMLGRQYGELLRYGRPAIDGQVTREFWAGASPPSPWPEDPTAPDLSEKAMREKMGDAWVDERLVWHRDWGVARDWTYLHPPERPE